MIQTINVSDFRDAFRACGRADQFSYEGLGALFDYLEEFDGGNYELDVIALCCDYSEDTVQEIAEAYGIDLSECSEGVCTASAYGLEQVAKAEAAVVLAYLEDHTSVVGETPNGFIYCSSF
jgi:hypothetical protein